MNKTGLFFVLLLGASAIATLMMGEIPWEAVWKGAVLKLKGLNPAWNPLLDERLPRLIVLACTGASLAVAGAVTQSLFHNPLASPSVLGISSGGCLAVVLVFVCDLHLKHPVLLPLSAFTGCMATLCLVYALSCLQQGSRLTRLILTGIAISSLIIALQNLVLYSMRHNWQLIQTISEWESGSSLDRNWSHVHLQLPLTLIGLGGCWLYRKELNILALGEEEAQNLGIEVSIIRWRLFLCISLLTAGSLAALGMIAFFGLVLPHVIRQLQGADNNRVIPLCIVGGAAVLITLDLILRQARLTSFSIGNLSAIIGGMFFLFLLFYNQKQAEHGFAR